MGDVRIKPGDRVRCRDAYGRWHEATAKSGPRVDQPNTLPNARNAVTVSVSGIWGYPINWPVEDVELVELMHYRCGRCGLTQSGWSYEPLLSHEDGHYWEITNYPTEGQSDGRS